MHGKDSGATVGSWKRLPHGGTKGGWTNGIWFTSIFTATFAVLTTSENCEALRKATIISAAITILCIMLGFISLIKEVRSWPED